jgi:hypothetical protein
MKQKLVIVGITLVIVAIGLSGCTQQQDALSGLGYKNTKYGFGFNPPEGWTVNESGTLGSVAIFYGPTEEGITVNIVITTTQLSTGDTLSNMTNNILAYYENFFTNFSLISSNASTVNGMNAYEIVYIYTQGVNDIIQKQVAIEKNTKVLILTYTGTFTSYDTYVSAFDQSVNSVVIL